MEAAVWRLPPAVSGATCKYLFLLTYSLKTPKIRSQRKVPLKKIEKIDNGLIPNAKNLAPMKIIFANLFIHSKFVDEKKPVQ